MRNKIVPKLSSLLLTATIIIGGIMSPIETTQKAQAAKKAYCATLKLSNNLKLNKTKTFEKTGIYQESTFFPEKQKVKIQYTVNCKRKLVGKNYQVTYKVNYKFFENPQIASDIIAYDDWLWGLTKPEALYTVFNYQTGKSLEAENNKLGVKVKGSDWKWTYYPKQKYSYTGILAEQYDSKDLWIHNYKSASYSFTVTYPKKCKDVVVGIGFVNKIESFDNSYEKMYWNGETPYGKTSYYKNGKKTMSYMRLK